MRRVQTQISLALALFLLGCGGGSSSTSSPSVVLPPSSPTPAPVPTPTPTPPATGCVIQFQNQTCIAGVLITPVSTPPPPAPPALPGFTNPAQWETAEYNSNYGLGQIGASLAYSKGAFGQGVKIAFIDVGNQTNHPEFLGGSIRLRLPSMMSAGISLRVTIAGLMDCKLLRLPWEPRMISGRTASHRGLSCSIFASMPGSLFPRWIIFPCTHLKILRNPLTMLSPMERRS